MNIAVCDDQDICLGEISGILAEYIDSIGIIKCKIQTYNNSETLLREYLPQKFLLFI